MLQIHPEDAFGKQMLMNLEVSRKRLPTPYALTAHIAALHHSLQVSCIIKLALSGKQYWVEEH